MRRRSSASASSPLGSRRRRRRFTTSTWWCSIAATTRPSPSQETTTAASRGHRLRATPKGSRPRAWTPLRNDPQRLSHHVLPEVRSVWGPRFAARSHSIVLGGLRFFASTPLYGRGSVAQSGVVSIEIVTDSELSGTFDAVAGRVGATSWTAPCCGSTGEQERSDGLGDGDSGNRLPATTATGDGRLERPANRKPRIR